MTDHFEDDSWRDELAEDVPEPTRPPLRIVNEKDQRPDITLGPNTHLTTEAMAAALKKDPELYQRAGSLSHVVRADPESVIPGIEPGSPVIRQVPLSLLVNRVSRFARCVTPRKTKAGTKWVQCPPPSTTVRAVLEQGAWSGIRELRGVLEAPSMRADGTLIQEPGYDRATGYLYEPNAAFQVVEEEPTQQAARDALDTLLHVFKDFPYASPHHAAVPIAALLTVLGRPAIRGAVPAFLFDASTRGSGKTLQCDVISTIATGRTAARANYPEKDEELEKVLAAYAMAGAKMVLLDNVTRMFGGGPIDAVLTCRDDVEFRILGKTETKRLPWQATLMVSGNNLLLGEDTTRRALIARLESQLENPEERTDFAHDNLIEWVRSFRPALIHAAITILRAYTAAGSPDMKCPRWGSFEEWSRLVPGAIVYAGGHDPMVARATLAPAVNDSKRTLMTLIEGLRRLCPATTPALSARDIIASLYPDRDPHDGPLAPDGYDALRDAVEQETGAMNGRKPEPKRLGKWLQKIRGRVVNGWCVQRQDGPNHTACWKAVSV